jgi:hypothetical protein
MGRRKSMDKLFEGRHFDREVIILCLTSTRVTQTPLFVAERGY